MANGLFMTPQQVAMMESQARAQQANTQNPLAGGMFNLGNSLGNAIQRGIGDVDTRSPTERRAQELQGFLQQVDFSQPESIMQAANALNQGGFQEQAFKMLSLIPKKEGKAGDPFMRQISVENDDGSFSTRNALFQYNAKGELKQVSSVLNRAVDGEDGGSERVYNFHPKLTKNVSDSDTIRAYTGKKLKSLPAFEGVDFEEDSIRPVVGQIIAIADQLKTRDRDKVRQDFMSGKIKPQEFVLQTGEQDSKYIDDALRLFISSDAGRSFVDKAFIGDDDVTVDPNKAFTVESLQQGRTENQQRAAIEQRLERPLPGTDDPRQGLVFNPRTITRDSTDPQAFTAKSLLQLLQSSEDLTSVREAIPIPMSDKRFDENKFYWSVLQSKRPETQTFIQNYVNREPGQGRKSLLSTEIANRKKDSDLIGELQIRQAARYLDLFKEAPDKFESEFNDVRLSP